MYIITASGRAIVHLDMYRKVFTTDMGDNVLVSVTTDQHQDLPTTIGRYYTMSQAIDAMKELFNAVEQGKQTFWMPAGVPEFEGKIHDARIKRKGGT